MKNLLAATSILTLALALPACSQQSAETAATPEASPATTSTAEAQTPPAEEAVEVEYGATGTYKIDPGHTSVIWSVPHMGLSNYSARFVGVDATLEFNPDDVTATALSVTIDPTTVSADYPGDYKGTHAGSGYETWDEDLSRDGKWLNSDVHPEITFVATAITKTGPTTGKVTGDLTLLGVTKPVTLDVTYNGTAQLSSGSERDSIGFSATTTIDRTDFGMGAYVPNIGANVDITIETEFAQVLEE